MFNYNKVGTHLSV